MDRWIGRPDMVEQIEGQRCELVLVALDEDPRLSRTDYKVRNKVGY